VDKTAVEIIDQLGGDFSNLAEQMSELTQVAWIMRSICIDEVVIKFLETHPKGTIVNIGCGLDTTFDRIDNDELLWYDLDLPDVIQLRKNFIKETDHRKFIGASFLETDWLNEIKVIEDVLFIAAGVFYYFKEHEVREFLICLADLYPGSEILFDVSSNYGVKVANKMVITRSGLDERSFLIWGLDNPKTISSWDKRLIIKDTYYYFGQRARSLSFKTRLFGLISDFLKIQYMINLQIA